eukprot:69485_1
MSTLLFLLYCILVVNSKIHIGIQALSAITEPTTNMPLSGRLTVAAQKLAIQSSSLSVIFNNDTHMLSDYFFEFSVLDSGGDTSRAINWSLAQITSTCSNRTNTLPIILGAPWSSLSSVTAPIFGLSNHIMISSTASSPLLSNPSS